jgi:hypothetical protein
MLAVARLLLVAGVAGCWAVDERREAECEGWGNANSEDGCEWRWASEVGCIGGQQQSSLLQAVGADSNSKTRGLW